MTLNLPALEPLNAPAHWSEEQRELGAAINGGMTRTELTLLAIQDAQTPGDLAAIEQDLFAGLRGWFQPGAITRRGDTHTRWNEETKQFDRPKRPAWAARIRAALDARAIEIREAARQPAHPRPAGPGSPERS